MKITIINTKILVDELKKSIWNSVYMEIYADIPITNFTLIIT